MSMGITLENTGELKKQIKQGTRKNKQRKEKIEMERISIL
jgi:hypothetical protein